MLLDGVNINEIMQLLSEHHQKAVYNLMISLVPAEYQDDVLTLEDLADIAEAEAEFARGETVSSEEIDAMIAQKEAERIPA